MAKKSKGSRRGTRRTLRKRVRKKTAITRYLQEFKLGQRVVIKPEPSSQKGMPFKRFFGRTGVITNKKGRSYIIKVREGNKEKKIVARPEHLRSI